MKPTREEIEAGRSPQGGFTRAQLAAWGIAWPPPRGWKKRLEREADEETLRRAKLQRGEFVETIRPGDFRRFTATTARRRVIETVLTNYFGGRTIEPTPKMVAELAYNIDLHLDGSEGLAA